MRSCDVSDNNLCGVRRTNMKMTDFANADEAKLANLLSTTIRRNRYLSHLNLSNTNLSNNLLLVVIVAIYRSRSLQAVHLCDNPGLLDSRVLEKCYLLFGDKHATIYDQPKMKLTLGAVLSNSFNKQITLK
jgi:hypothetical protein